MLPSRVRRCGRAVSKPCKKYTPVGYTRRPKVASTRLHTPRWVLRTDVAHPPSTFAKLLVPRRGRPATGPPGRPRRAVLQRGPQHMPDQAEAVRGDSGPAG